jgi:6-phosphogluconolactonase (cycloisomerase 2 family)
MSNLSELLPSGGGQNVVEFTASGAVASGKPVILNANGTVTEVSETSVSSNVGAETVFDTGAYNWEAIASDGTSSKVVVVYRDGNGSNYGTAVVGTISGTTISFGTPVVFESASTISIDIEYSPDADKFLIAYADLGNSSFGTGIVGTISGTSISFGSATVFSSGSTSNTSVTYDTSNDKFVVFFADNSNSAYATGVVGTVSGTSVSFGSKTVAESVSSGWPTVTYDPVNAKCVALYRDEGSTGYGRAAVGTVSGTSISFGTPVTFQAGATRYISAAYDAKAARIVAAYEYFTDSQKGYAIAGEVSGTTTTWGTHVKYEDSVVQYVAASYDATVERCTIAFRDDTSVDGKIIPTNLSGSTISYGAPDTFNPAGVTYVATTYNSTEGKIVLAYADIGNGSAGTSLVYTTAGSVTNLTATNFIGLASAAISDTATGNINVKGGINEAQTGLTIGSDYYVQNDGSLAATNIPYDISSASYDSVSFSVTSQDTEPVGLTFNNDGTKMFIVGTTNDNVYEYSLSTAYDISSASYTQSFSVSSQDTFPTGIRFNNDGTKMFVVGGAGQDINEYALSSAFDISSASYTRNFSTSTQETAPNGLAFNSDGTKMFVTGGSGQDVNEYSLSTGFDLSSVSFTQNFSLSSQDTLPREVTFNSDGTKMYIVGSSNDSVFQYNLTTGFDLSTASYANISFSLSSQDTSPEGIAFNSSGTKMYIVGDINDSVYQYSTTAASTTVKVGQAISATTINMMDLT